MQKLQFSDRKSLSLKNVISKEYVPSNGSEDKKHFDMLNTFAKSKQIETFGPPIVYTSGTIGIDIDGKPIVKNKVMLQCKSPLLTRVSPPYNYEGNINVVDTLYVRFHDKLEKLIYSNYKMLLFAYENDINLEGGVYSIVIDEDKKTNRITVDLFMPIKKQNKGELK
jgi:hypothetical protein